MWCGGLYGDIIGIVVSNFNLAGTALSRTCVQCSCPNPLLGVFRGPSHPDNQACVPSTHIQIPSGNSTWMRALRSKLGQTWWWWGTRSSSHSHTAEGQKQVTSNSSLWGGGGDDEDWSVSFCVLSVSLCIHICHSVIPLRHSVFSLCHYVSMCHCAHSVMPLYHSVSMCVILCSLCVILCPCVSFCDLYVILCSMSFYVHVCHSASLCIILCPSVSFCVSECYPVFSLPNFSSLVLLCYLHLLPSYLLPILQTRPSSK